jgi:hypothetical protein
MLAGPHRTEGKSTPCLDTLVRRFVPVNEFVPESQILRIAHQDTLRPGKKFTICHISRAADHPAE